MKNRLKATVFISCGQAEKSERKTADKISLLLEKMGYEPYVAIKQSSPKGLRDSIFNQLRDSEYYLLVDFKREKVEYEGKLKEILKDTPYRGSLFTHQELAIASYLNIEMLAFREQGLNLREGVAGIIHLEDNIFQNERELLDKIKTKVKHSWKPNWKNALSLEYDPSVYKEAKINTPYGSNARFFQLQVKNMHKNRIAKNCTGYVRSIKNLRTNKMISFLSAELRWSGYLYPSVSIMPEDVRELDAFHIIEHYENVAFFNSFASASNYMQPIKGPGKYEIEYTVVSDNMPPVTQTFRLILNKTIKGVKFRTV